MMGWNRRRVVGAPVLRVPVVSEQEGGGGNESVYGDEVGSVGGVSAGGSSLGGLGSGSASAGGWGFHSLGSDSGIWEKV